MEWVETTAKTVEEAKDLALDQLGVDELEAEFEVVAEPKPGLFGRLRGEARVRARVRPTKPRPKVDHRDRRRKRKGEGGGGQRSRGGRGPRSKNSGRDGDSAVPDGDRAGSGRDGDKDRSGGGRRRPRSGGGQDRRRSASGNAGNATTANDQRDQEATTVEPLSPHRQAEIAGEFLTGLATAFGTSGTVELVEVSDDMVEARLVGDDLGFLIGPRGSTLSAIYELSKTVVQRHGEGAREGRFRIDIGGYRERRREALVRFVTDLAEKVREEGEERALEPMGAADRKVVHDTVNEIDGVSTRSEGDEPRRRVVILPDS